jgi:hypothetical protein
MEEAEKIVSTVSGSDPLVLALMVALAGIALGAMALWVLMRLHVMKDGK